MPVAGGCQCLGRELQHERFHQRALHDLAELVGFADEADHHLRRRDRVRVAPGLFGCRPDVGQLARICLGPGAARRPPAVAEFADEVQHAGAVGADPNRWRTGGVRLGVQPGVRQREVASGDVDRPVGVPQQSDQTHRLGEPAHRAPVVEPVGNQVLALAGAEPEDEPAVREMAQSQRRLGQHHRVAPDGVEDAGGEPGACRASRDRTGESERVDVAVRRWRHVREVGELGRPDRVGPEAHQVVGHPQRVVAAVVQVIQPAEVERQSRPEERGQLQGHAKEATGRARLRQGNAERMLSTRPGCYFGERK
ncbi:hypothetical protein MCHLDSM_05874 [Mycolicibacterium chlorophenolicum]|uniref:Uncharacterized protein n=1 Tax=Mycolicibacterium chlorophenolicum TaxID=37916 RepID=A0A0J6VL70_9MYCO|nr:hypothetical protein MCHLDSM_05874 [Mycolicibacterium chlorophenolicum]